MKSYAPLLAFLVLAVFLAAGLKLNPRIVPSPLVGKPAPDFALPQLDGAGQQIRPADFAGEVWVLNVWASWCASCIAEHPLLVNLLQDEVMLVGLNYKDQAAGALKWLAERGDPYQASAVDADGAAGLDWGVYGVPETFVIDSAGIVRHKHIGPLTQADITETLLPLVRRLQGRTAAG